MAEQTLQPGVKITARQLCPAACGGQRGSTNPPAAPGGDHAEQVDAQRRLWHHGVPVLEQGQVCLYPWESQAGTGCAWRADPLERDPRWRSSWRAAAQGLPLEKSVEDSLPVRDCLLNQRKEAVVETTWDGLIVASIPHVPALLRGAGGELGIKLKLMKEGMGKRRYF